MSEKQHDKAVISDMDGVLVDSFHNFYLAYKDIVNEHGVNGFSEDYYRQFFGAKGDYTKSKIESDFNIDLGDRDKFMERKDRLYLENALKSTIPFDNTVEAIKKLSNRYKIAVASSSDKRIVDHSLKSIGLDDIRIRISGDMVSKGKPNPDTFILARETLGVKPENCVVIEDSVPGMNAAHGAGIRCICLLADGVEASGYDKADVIFRINNIESEILINKVIEMLG
jgi:HAD superfamily hydrolase (TIGR01509 family)